MGDVDVNVPNRREATMPGPVGILRERRCRGGMAIALREMPVPAVREGPAVTEIKPIVIAMRAYGAMVV